MEAEVSVWPSFSDNGTLPGKVLREANIVKAAPCKIQGRKILQRDKQGVESTRPVGLVA